MLELAKCWRSNENKSERMTFPSCRFHFHFRIPEIPSDAFYSMGGGRVPRVLRYDENALD
jgi:hypothetical protein